MSIFKVTNISKEYEIFRDFVGAASKKSMKYNIYLHLQADEIFIKNYNLLKLFGTVLLFETNTAQISDRESV